MSIIRLKGRVISVATSDHILPNGIRTKLDVVRHPGAVLILPYLSRDRIILIRQFRPTIKKYLLELPAGTLKLRESPLACAQRELIEETGYKASKIVKIGKVYPVPGYSTELITMFKAQGLQQQYAEKDPDEMIEVQPYTISEIKDLLCQGKIIDAKTICALALDGIFSI